MRLHCIIHGRVQGIFFRANTVEQAKKLNLTGWVKNNPDGTVEFVAEGEKSNLELLFRWANKGPSAARVDKIESDWEEETGEFDRFEQS